MLEGIFHFFRVEVQIPQGLVTDDISDFLQASGQVLGQGPHGHTLNFTIHNN